MPKPSVALRGIDTGSRGFRLCGMCRMGCAAQPETEERAMNSSIKSSVNSRKLKKHLRYIVPEIRLVLIKEPGAKPALLQSK